MTTDSTANPTSMKTRKGSLWRQISDHLQTQIEQGQLRGGERVPTDVELAERFACNKHTARRAVAHLEQLGMVRVEWGRGTFVVDRAIAQGQSAEACMVHRLLDQHRNHRLKVVRTERLPATQTLARGLRIALGSPCLLLVLISEADDVPLSLGFNYFPLKRLPSLATFDASNFTSVAAALLAAGVTAQRRTRVRIGARLPTTEEAMQLKMARQQPLLETESSDVDGGGHPITYAKTCFRADRLQLIVPSA